MMKTIENSKYMVYYMYRDYQYSYSGADKISGIVFFDTEEEAVAHAKKMQVSSSYTYYVSRTPHIKVQRKQPEVEAIYL